MYIGINGFDQFINSLLVGVSKVYAYRLVIVIVIVPVCNLSVRINYHNPEVQIDGHLLYAPLPYLFILF